MATAYPATISFKFRWVDEKGNETGMFRRRGRFDGQTLVLDKAAVPVGGIADIEIRENRMLLTTVTEDGEPAALLLGTSPKVAKRLKTALDSARSAV